MRWVNLGTVQEADIYYASEVLCFDFVCLRAPPPNETYVILNILYKSIAMKFSTWYPDDFSY